VNKIHYKMTSLSLLSIGGNGLGHGRGLSSLVSLRLGRSARHVCIIQSNWLDVGSHESNMLNSYNQLSNRLDNRVSCKRGRRMHVPPRMTQ